MPDAPKILIAGLKSWAGVARLPRALQDAGFKVGIACRENSFLAATRFRDRFFPWDATGRRGSTLFRQLKTIIDEWRPDFLVPADEPAVVFLARAFGRLKPSDPLASLLEYSLGRPPAMLEAASKYRTFQRAQQCGIRVPCSQPVSSETEMLAFAGKNGFPFLLKKSYGWSGHGVALCRDEPEALAAWKNWHRKPAWKRRFYSWRNQVRGRELGSRWLPADQVIMASQFIAGKPAMCLLTAFEGQVLAAMTALKVNCYPGQLGPGSVVRFVPNEEIRQAAQKLAGAWGVSGFIGFDFIVDLQGAAWLIECNPRPTPVAHLGARLSEDICAALYCRLTGQPPPAIKPHVELVVAHFPFESLRDPASPYLAGAFHDVPVDDPGLMESLSRLRK